MTKIKRAIAAAPTLDEIDVLAAAARLTSDQTHALRVKLVTQCAARTFSVDEGRYEIEEGTSESVAEGGIDVRRVIYMGAHLNLSQERMVSDLRQFGTRFTVKPSVIDELARFGFGRPEIPIIKALQVCGSLAELEARFREIDPRAAQSVLYAFASCDGLAPLPTLELGPEEPAFDEHSIAQGTPGLAKVPAAFDFDEISETAAPAFDGPLTKAISSLVRDQLRSGARPTFGDGVPLPLDEHTMQTVPAPSRSMIETFRTGKMTTVRPNALARHEVISLINERIALLDNGADHFALLGLPIGAPIEDVHAAYVELSRHLKPARLAELKISDEGFLAQRLFAQIAIAFTVLTDRIRRPEYMATLTSLKRAKH
jgi:hypothetical protein